MYPQRGGKKSAYWLESLQSLTPLKATSPTVNPCRSLHTVQPREPTASRSRHVSNKFQTRPGKLLHHWIRARIPKNPITKSSPLNLRVTQSMRIWMPKIESPGSSCKTLLMALGAVVYYSRYVGKQPCGPSISVLLVLFMCGLALTDPGPPAKYRPLASHNPTPGTSNRPDTTTALPAVTACDAYGIDWYHNELDYFQGLDWDNRQALCSFDSTKKFYAGSLRDGNSSAMYVVDYDTGELFSMSTTDCTLTDLGRAIPMMTGMAWSRVDQVMYGVVSDCNYGSELLVVDLNSAVVTLVTEIDSVCVMDIADVNGVLYGIDNTLNAGIRINKSDGSTENVYQMGYDINSPQGMDYSPCDNFLYYSSYSNTGMWIAIYLYMIDMSTKENSFSPLLYPLDSFTISWKLAESSSQSVSDSMSYSDSSVVRPSGCKAYMLAFNSYSLVKYIPETREYQSVCYYAPAEFACGEFAYEDTSVMYVIDSRTSVFSAMDMADCHLTFIARCDVPSNLKATGMTWDPVSQQMFVVFTDCWFSSLLYRIDLHTGTLSLVGIISIGIGDCVDDIAIGHGLKLYGYSSGPLYQFFEIDKYNASTTVIFSTTDTYMFGFGLDYNPCDGLLYCTVQNGYNWAYELYSIDPIDGSLTLQQTLLDPYDALSFSLSTDPSSGSTQASPLSDPSGGVPSHCLGYVYSLTQYQLLQFSADSMDFVPLCVYLGYDVSAAEIVGDDYWVLVSDVNLYTIDPKTCVMSPLATINTTGPTCGMSYSKNDLLLYVVTSDCWSFSSLYSIDNNFTTTHVCDFQKALCILDIAVDEAGVMYALDSASERLLIVDTSNCETWTLGNIGFTTGDGGASLDWDPCSSLLYLTAYNVNKQIYQLSYLSYQDGHATVLEELQDSVIGLSFQDILPSESFSALAESSSESKTSSNDNSTLWLAIGISAAFGVFAIACVFILVVIYWKKKVKFHHEETSLLVPTETPPPYTSQPINEHGKSPQTYTYISYITPGSGSGYTDAPGATTAAPPGVPPTLS
ncbi:hypothetical protein Pelo_278 [Pelomyxa schiedti]|nr:hypothetical protein Pelo_278 [Pelomyxa schiedti]